MTKQFDLDPIVTDSDVILKGFRFRKRELALGAMVVVCFLVIIILAALLASANSKSDSSTACTGDTGAQSGGSPPPTGRPSRPPGRSTPAPPPCDCPWYENQTCLEPSCLRAASHVLDLVNTTMSPCDDFHTYTCANFAKLNPLAPDEDELTPSWNIYNKNQERIRKLLEKPAISSDPESYDVKLKDFFSSCTDHFYSMQKRGKPLLDQVLRKLPGGWWALAETEGQWDDSEWDVNHALRLVHVDYWTDVFFTYRLAPDMLDWNKASILIHLSGLGLPDYYYTDTEREDLEKARKDYKTFIRTVGSYLLRDAEMDISDTERNTRLETFVNDAYSVEAEIASLQENAKSTEDPHSREQRMTLQELNDQTGAVLNWVDLFTYMFDNAGVTGDTAVVVMSKDYVLKLTQWMKNMTDTQGREFHRKVHNYMVWRLIDRYVQDLSWEYIHANRQIYVDLTGAVEFLGTWRYCVGKVDRDMYEALGALFVRDHFADKNKEKAHEITGYVKDALIDSLKSQHWMSSETSRMAANKVKESLIKLGYPDYMLNENKLNYIYRDLEVNKTEYFSNLLSFNKFFKRHWNDYLKNVGNRTVWVYPTYSFVAEYYNPWHELIIPAGLLQFPIFDYKSPHYMNFGSLGAIAGRQLVHAVDEIGNYYHLDGTGWAEDGAWWSNATRDTYEKVKQCFLEAWADVKQGPHEMPVNVDYYYPYALGEASGVRIAYNAYKSWMSSNKEKKMPGSSWTKEQSFFVAYAQTFCYTRTPQAALEQARWRPWTVQENVRVNEALAQLPEFQKAFQCSDSSRMVAPKRCWLY